MTNDPIEEFREGKSMVERGMMLMKKGEERMDNAFEKMKENRDKAIMHREDKLLNKKEAAEMLGVSRQTIYNMIERDEMNVGRNGKIFKSVIERLMYDQDDSYDFVTPGKMPTPLPQPAVQIQSCSVEEYWDLVSQYRFN